MNQEIKNFFFVLKKTKARKFHGMKKNKLFRLIKLWRRNTITSSFIDAITVNNN